MAQEGYIINELSCLCGKSMWAWAQEPRNLIEVYIN